MTASTLKLILLLLVLGLVSTGCANQNTKTVSKKETQNETKSEKYPDENDYLGSKLKIKAPKVSRDNYHAFLDKH